MPKTVRPVSRAATSTPAPPALASPAPPAAPSSDADTERVARRAYDRFLRRGGEHGRDQEDWFEAERDLNGHRDD
jgi:hypothetical protein